MGNKNYEKLHQFVILLNCTEMHGTKNIKYSHTFLSEILQNPYLQPIRISYYGTAHRIHCFSPPEMEIDEIT
jgi:hypothetical protein